MFAAAGRLQLRMKPGEARQEGMVSYHFRPGIHNLTLHDWTRYMDFADKLGWRK